jgi:hypothetical protein
MSQTYRIQYSLKPSGQQRHAAGNVETVDLTTELDKIPSLLPPSAYIMYVEDLTAGQYVHWTRWPLAFRPGFGG